MFSGGEDRAARISEPTFSDRGMILVGRGRVPKRLDRTAGSWLGHLNALYFMQNLAFANKCSWKLGRVFFFKESKKNWIDVNKKPLFFFSFFTFYCWFCWKYWPAFVGSPPFLHWCVLGYFFFFFALGIVMLIFGKATWSHCEYLELEFKVGAVLVKRKKKKKSWSTRANMHQVNCEHFLGYKLHTILRWQEIA